MSQVVAKVDQLSDSEIDDASKITDPASCLDYLKRREVFLYKMMNDPSHKAMLYFLEVLMNSEVPLTVEQLAARFSNKSFSNEMKEACGGGSVDALKEFLLKYPSLFTVKPTGLVSAVAIEMPGFDEMSESSIDVDCFSLNRSPQNTTTTVSSSCRLDQRAVSKSSNETNENPTPSTQPAPLKSSLKNSTNGGNNNNEVKPVGIYQPPILRAQAAAASATTQNRSSHICDMCSIAAHVATTATTTVVHCPFTDLNCLGHHHYHHGQRFNQLPKHSHTATSYCCCSADLASPYCRPSGKGVTCSQVTNFTLEAEAVKFFQQRLSRKEERWVPIKSLAGHLSQASAEVRSIVGPQLEFRRFLLKHPHVFEVQGDLVGLKDPFIATCLSSRRPKSFGGSSLNSQSSSSLSTLNLRGATGPGGVTGSQNVLRPKSLIMLSQASSTAVSAPIPRRLGNVPTGSEHFLLGRNLESLTVSAPNTPNSQQNRNGSSSVRPRHNGSMQNFAHYNSPQNDADSSSARQPSRRNRGQEVDATTSTSGSICIRMSANEYRAIMFLRKVLAKKGGAPGQAGLSYMQLMQILSAKAPETVQSAIGWTKVELEEFILQHPIFFEVHACTDANKTHSGNNVTWARVETSEQSTTLVTNRRVLKMINIVITGNKSLDSGIRTMTNRCGRVFHVAKLWGIIDLGKHEHVFFDKSILKYVDDLQKHFKVNETLYFNAILAPKESRAKWRATQVWKECDKEIMEKFGGSAFTDRSGGRIATLLSVVGREEEGRKSNTTVADSDSSDYGLAEEEEVEGELGEAPGTTRAEGLNPTNDINFLSDDVEAELERILGPNQEITTADTTNSLPNASNRVPNDVSDEDTSITGCIEDISVNFSDAGSLPERYSQCVTSTTQKEKKSMYAADSPLGERSSIATCKSTTAQKNPFTHISQMHTSLHPITNTFSLTCGMQSYFAALLTGHKVILCFEGQFFVPFIARL
ncbi:expressed conserved protein [Echinococcus multilocularis]|uniref:Expressed conserved protein n=1 Tax=Echinococcus multilocularis TaxID=6211 RepID=A0A068YB05_ECHMU|nr:expressed conserved protein [Echinococcus multilocularis]